MFTSIWKYTKEVHKLDTISFIMPILFNLMFLLLLYKQVVLDCCGRFVGFGSFLKHQLYIHEFHPKSEKKSKMQLAVRQDHGISQHMFHGAVF